MNYRLYTFTNFYMSPIQHGIQSAHLVHELFIKHRGTYPSLQQREILYEWATNHRTMIVLSAGNLEGLKEAERHVAKVSESLNLPGTYFNEDEASLGGVLTCVGIVLPECIYDAKFYDGPNKYWYFSDSFRFDEGTVEAEFITYLKGCRLA